MGRKDLIKEGYIVAGVNLLSCILIFAFSPVWYVKAIGAVNFFCFYITCLVLSSLHLEDDVKPGP